MNPPHELIPVILCGGSGTRLWPLSRESYPKQFLSLYGDGLSMLQHTALRLQGMAATPEHGQRGAGQGDQHEGHAGHQRPVEHAVGAGVAQIASARGGERGQGGGVHRAGA